MPTITKTAKTSKVVSSPSRPVVYAEVYSADYLGDEAMTVAQARELLGWRTEKEHGQLLFEQKKIKKAEDFKYLKKDPSGEVDKETGKPKMVPVEGVFTDIEGSKVKCWNNTTNRELDIELCKKYAQDILNRNWADSRNGGTQTFKLPDGTEIELPVETQNGEAIIVGRHGSILSGQHRLIALVFAGQMWASKKDGPYWQTKWAEEPSFEVTVAFGRAESQKTIRTIDNGKPRSTSDVIHTSGLFSKLEPSERKLCDRMLAVALDLLWKRTGMADAKVDAFHKHHHYRTHSETMDFLDRHKKLLDCISHVYDENKERQISTQGLSPGRCAALMYLMAASGTDVNDYRGADVPSEKKVNFDAWDEAADFFVLLGDQAKGPKGKLAPVWRGFKALLGESGERTPTEEERITVLIKAWNLFVKGEKIHDEDLRVTLTADANGVLRLDDFPTLGGIDVGLPVKKKEQDHEVTNGGEGEDPEDIEAAAEASRKATKDMEDKLEAEKRKRAAENRKKLLARRAEKNGTAVTEEPSENGEEEEKPKKRPLRGRAAILAKQTEDARKADEEKEREEAAALGEPEEEVVDEDEPAEDEIDEELLEEGDSDE